MSRQPPQLRHAFRLDVELSPALEVGSTYLGHRRVIPITGGRVSGERVNGRILPGGADWNVVRPDGVIHLWARYEIEGDDGCLISVINEGLGRMSREKLAQVTGGHVASSEPWYTRTSPKFETASEKYRWLNATVFIGDLLPPHVPGAVSIEVYEVL